MKEAIVHEGPRVELLESEIPKPASNEVTIKVEVTGTNPKDWKIYFVENRAINQGNDIAGTVHEIGSDVSEFKVGDRVMGFHAYGAPHGGHAEYATADAATTSLIPAKTSYEEAATFPMAAMTAAIGLYRILRLPEPWMPAEVPTPLVIYGGSSAVGAFAIKLAHLSNIHPIIAVAGRACPFVSTLLDRSKGDAVIDYRKGNVSEAIQKALNDSGVTTGVHHAFDAISEPGCPEALLKVLDPKGRLTYVSPLQEGVLESAPDVKSGMVICGEVWELMGPSPGARDFGYLMMRYFVRGLDTGVLKGHPHVVVPGGLDSLQSVLQDLKAGKASGVKYLLKVGES